MKFEKYINESSLSRIWQFVEDNKKQFAVISASRKLNSDEENEKNYIELIKDIRDLGYGYIKMRGGYKEKTGFVREKSLFVPNIKKSEIIELGRKYNQDSILFKDVNKFVEIGTNKETGIGKILMNFKKQSNVDNLNLAKDAIKKFFSSLLKGNHKGKKFVFNLQEESEVGLWGRMGGRTPRWFNII